METTPTAESAESTPRRHGRRARPLTPEEQAELNAKRAEYERINGPIDGQSGASPAASADADPTPPRAATDDTAKIPVTSAPLPGDSAEPPAAPAAPSLRRFGRRARIVEVDDAPTPTDQEALRPVDDTAVGTVTVSPVPASIPTDADGVELGEMAVGDAPDPRPAPRFEGRVLHRPQRSGGSPVVWIIWILVAIALVAIVALLLLGVLGGESAQALAALVPVDTAPAVLPSTLVPTQEVVSA